MKYEIVKYRPEFKNQIVELQTHLWNPHVSVNVAYLEWKYEHNPYMATPLIYVVLYAGKVVGMRGMYGATWQIGHPPQVLHALCVGDSVVAPDHRNRGLFTQLTRTALNDLADMGYKYVFNLSASPVTHLAVLAMGWQSVGYLQTMRWTARHSIVPHRLQRYMMKLPFHPSAKKRHPFHFLDTNGSEHRGQASPYVFVEQTPRPAAMAELVESIGGDGRIRSVRDRAYFAWRFSNPHSLYRFLFWEDGTMEGYLVLQTRLSKDEVRINIVDWEAANPWVRSDLLQAAIHWGNFDALNIWSATLLGKAKTLLQNTGFRLLDEPRGVAHHCPALLVRPVRDEMLKADWAVANRRLLDLANWDLRMIYSDSY